MRPTKGLNAALNKLAALYEYGALQASTDPVGFLGRVCEELEELRAARTMKCRECRGRGWHVGECHPQETCGVCDGSGAVLVDTLDRATETQGKP